MVLAASWNELAHGGAIPARIIINPSQTQPIPQQDRNHHCNPAPIVNQENSCHPAMIAEYQGPGNTIDRKYQAGPNQQQGSPSGVYARKGKKYPDWHII